MNKSLEACENVLCCDLHKTRQKYRCASNNVFKIKKYMEENNLINVMENKCFF